LIEQSFAYLDKLDTYIANGLFDQLSGFDHGFRDTKFDHKNQNKEVEGNRDEMEDEENEPFENQECLEEVDSDGRRKKKSMTSSKISKNSRRIKKESKYIESP
jgi:hypothetical protein